MATEKRLIDANAFRDYWNKNYRHQYANDTFLFAIANFPTVDAVEVVHGRWEYDVACEPYCSNCGSYALQLGFEKVKSNYCPNCGAKMDGDGNG